jgi:hypothetical protein
MDPSWRDFFPAGSLDLHRHRAEEFALFLQRMEEPPLHPAGGQQPLTIRLLCLPTWSRACAVRIESHGLWRRLVGKETSGEAAFEVGEVVRRESRLLTAAESAQVDELWQYLRFGSLPASDDECVFDGTTYLLEAARHGRYGVAVREDPEWGDTFGEFCGLMLSLAGFGPR